MLSLLLRHIRHWQHCYCMQENFLKQSGYLQILTLNPCCLLWYANNKCFTFNLCIFCWYVITFLLYTVLAFTVVASAQCNEVQLLVNDTEFTADILYMPVNSSVVVECECTSGERKSDWLYSNGTTIAPCTKNSDLLCTMNTGVLFLSRLLVGNYTCSHGNTSKILHIDELGQLIIFDLLYKYNLQDIGII